MQLVFWFDSIVEQKPAMSVPAAEAKARLTEWFETMRTQLNAMEQSLRFDGDVDIDPNDDFFDDISPEPGIFMVR